MDPVTETPTAPSDYALLSTTYVGLLAALAETARRRQGTFDIKGRELLPLSAATFALSKLIVHEKVETWVRAPFVEEAKDGKRPKGRRLRYAVGELLSCTRCMGRKPPSAASIPSSPSASITVSRTSRPSRPTSTRCTCHTATTWSITRSTRTRPCCAWPR